MSVDFSLSKSYPEEKCVVSHNHEQATCPSSRADIDISNLPSRQERVTNCIQTIFCTCLHVNADFWRSFLEYEDPGAAYVDPET